jgi:hypothetical protein
VKEIFHLDTKSIEKGAGIKYKQKQPGVRLYGRLVTCQTLPDFNNWPVTRQYIMSMLAALLAARQFAYSLVH